MGRIIEGTELENGCDFINQGRWNGEKDTNLNELKGFLQSDQSSQLTVKHVDQLRAV